MSTCYCVGCTATSQLAVNKHIHTDTHRDIEIHRDTNIHASTLPDCCINQRLQY